MKISVQVQVVKRRNFQQTDAVGSTKSTQIVVHT
jgi:hypothetical protein